MTVAGTARSLCEDEVLKVSAVANKTVSAGEDLVATCHYEQSLLLGTPNLKHLEALCPESEPYPEPLCHIAISCMFNSCRISEVSSEFSVAKSQARALGHIVEVKRGDVAEVLDALVPEDSISSSCA